MVEKGNKVALNTAEMVLACTEGIGVVYNRHRFSINRKEEKVT
jgi:hypothetical protein